MVVVNGFALAGRAKSSLAEKCFCRPVYKDKDDRTGDRPCLYVMMIGKREILPDYWCRLHFL
jgi:hypothetical protein